MKLSPVATQLLRTASPTLLAALALPPPLNALAATVVSSALGRFAPADGGAPLKPEQVARTIEEHASDPTMVPALQQAEADLQRYEDENRFRFAQLEAKDRESARAMHVASGMSETIFQDGIKIVWIALVGMLVMVAGLLYLGHSRRSHQTRARQPRHRRVRADRDGGRLRQRAGGDGCRLLLGQQPGLQGEGPGDQRVRHEAHR